MAEWIYGHRHVRLWAVLFLALILSLGPLAIPPGEAHAGRPAQDDQPATGAPPDPPALVAPSDGAPDLNPSPLLRVGVSDPELDPMSVTFLGRAVHPAPADDFTIAALPDTQGYSDGHPDIFMAQTRWIVENRARLNIVYVAHEGDIVNESKQKVQWERADAAMSLLEDPLTTGLPDGIPYSVVAGNHDLPGPYYDDFFGQSRFEGRAYYGGGYPKGENRSNFTLFSASGIDFISVGLDYESVAPGTLEWADSVLKAHANRRAIVVSHHVLEEDGSFGKWGTRVYEALKGNPNLFLILCGHRHTENRRFEVYEGRRVDVLLADFQTYTDGGSGFLRLLRFSPRENKIRVSTYSPWLDEYEVDEQSEFVLDYDMSGGGLLHELGTVGGVASGHEASLLWPDLDQGTRYEWQARVSDGTGSTTGPQWAFRTAGFGGYALQVESYGGGTVSRTPQQITYDEGQVVELVAYPDPNHVLWYWSGDLSGAENPVRVVMDAPKVVIARFREMGPPFEARLPLVIGAVR